MDEYGAFGLGGDHEDDTDQVGGETGPGCVGDGQNTAVHEGFHLVVVLGRNQDIITFVFHFDTDTAEHLGNDAQLLDAGVFDGEFRTCHGSHADEGTNFNHVCQQPVFGAVKFTYSIDSQ